jgi:stearoyl-CoA desaturase (Delta-9 desaturase)
MNSALIKMDSSKARRNAASIMHDTDDSKGAQAVQGKIINDGTKDYQPLRSKQYDLRKTHITETPITWSNWYRHVNWLNTFFIFGVPIIGFAAAYHHPLNRWTALFSVIYYFNTGLGITAGTFIP